MNIYKTELFPYLSGPMLNGSVWPLTIKGFEVERMEGRRGVESKFVISFVETDKKLILNKTNAQIIAMLHGEETDGWKGKQINVYAEDVRAFGETHRVVRVSSQMPQPKSTKSTANEPISRDENLDPAATLDEAEQDPLFPDEPVPANGAYEV